MTADEAERLWSELRRLDARQDALERETPRRSEVATKGDVLHLHEAFSSLEESVREVIEVQRDSVVQMPPPMASVGPLARGRRAKVWELVLAGVALVLTGAGAVLVERCKTP